MEHPKSTLHNALSIIRQIDEFDEILSDPYRSELTKVRLIHSTVKRIKRDLLIDSVSQLDFFKATQFPAI